MNSSRRRQKFSRRSFLKSIGASAAYLPLLEASFADAASTYTGPKRLFVITQCNGCIPGEFYPTGSGTDLTALTMGQTTSALNAYKKDLVLFGDLSWYGASDKAMLAGVDTSHGAFAQMLSGGNNKLIFPPNDWAQATPNGPSLDQYVAQSFKQQGVSTALPSLNMTLGAGGNVFYGSRCFFTGPDQSLAGEADPQKIFDTLFAANAMPTPAIDLAHKRRKSILDQLGPQLETFAKNLGTDDRVRIQAHLQAVQDLEARLMPTTAGPVTCTPPPRPTMGAGDGWPGEGYIRADAWDRFALLTQLGAVALQCDVTRVVGLQLMDMNGKPLYFNTPIATTADAFRNATGGYDEYHTIAHAAGQNKIDADKWMLSFMAGLMGQMKGVSEGGGTLLDHSLVLWANSFGDGGAHTGPPLPWALGGGSALIKTGQYVRGALVTNLMQTVLTGLGLGTNTFGDPNATDRGPIGQLTL